MERRRGARSLAGGGRPLGRGSPEVDVEASATREARWLDGRELDPGVAGRRDRAMGGEARRGNGLRSTAPKEPRVGWARHGFPGRLRVDRHGSKRSRHHELMLWPTWRCGTGRERG
jgi:hypothetical protein